MATLNNFLTIVGVIPRSRFPNSHHLENQRINTVEAPLLDDLNATATNLLNTTLEALAVIEPIAEALPINVPTIAQIASANLPVAIPGNLTLPTCPIVAPITQNHTIFFLSNIGEEVRRQTVQAAQNLLTPSNLIGAFVAEQNYSAGNSCFVQTQVNPPINATFGLYDPAALAPQGPSFLIVAGVALAAIITFRVGLAVYQKYFTEPSPSQAKKPAYSQNLMARLQRRRTTANVSFRHSPVRPDCRKSQTTLEFQKQFLLP